MFWCVVPLFFALAFIGVPPPIAFRLDPPKTAVGALLDPANK
jgi:hypothetical protein